MKKNYSLLNSLFFFVAALAAASCTKYNVTGTSSLQNMDGHTLYLKGIVNDELVNIDSCEVVHGKFRFSGSIDTTQMASLFMDDESIMPLVVEKGHINIHIDNAQQKVSGTTLNEKLYEFLEKHDRLNNQMRELDHRYSQMLLDGIDEEDINRTLTAESAVIVQQEDSLVTNFVVDNFENVLGPFVFIQMSSSVPQIEHIMSKAPETFKQRADVEEFYKIATGDENAD